MFQRLLPVLAMLLAGTLAGCAVAATPAPSPNRAAAATERAATPTPAPLLSVAERRSSGPVGLGLDVVQHDLERQGFTESGRADSNGEVVLTMTGPGADTVMVTGDPVLSMAFFGRVKESERQLAVARTYLSDEAMTWIGDHLLPLAGSGRQTKAFGKVNITLDPVRSMSKDLFLIFVSKWI